MLVLSNFCKIKTRWVKPTSTSSWGWLVLKWTYLMISILVSTLILIPMTYLKHNPSTLVLTYGSKGVTRSQIDYFGKRLQVFFYENNFYMQINFWMKCFVIYFNWLKKILQCITCFFASDYWINIKFLKCENSLQIQCFISKNDQNFKSSPKFKYSHSLILLNVKI
jgi:hypothetical protein